MPEMSERRRKPRLKPSHSGEPVWVMLHNVPGSTAQVRARLVDTSDLGLGVETDCRLEPNSVLTVEGRLSNYGPNGSMRAKVVNCKPYQNLFRAGLTFETVSENGNGSSAGSSAASTSTTPFRITMSCCRLAPMRIPT